MAELFIIAQTLGLPLIPPYKNTSGSDVLKGVNYASGAAGILPETGQQMVIYNMKIIINC